MDGAEKPHVTSQTRSGNACLPTVPRCSWPGLLVAYNAAQRTDADAFANSVGLAISPTEAATILRREQKVTVIRAGAKQNYAVGLIPNGDRGSVDSASLSHCENVRAGTSTC